MHDCVMHGDVDVGSAFVLINVFSVYEEDDEGVGVLRRTLV